VERTAQVSVPEALFSTVLNVEETSVRCCDCRVEYPQPPRGEPVECPRCGSRRWVSAQIPFDLPERPAE